MEEKVEKVLCYFTQDGKNFPAIVDLLKEDDAWYLVGAWQMTHDGEIPSQRMKVNPWDLDPVFERGCQYQLKQAIQWKGQWPPFSASFPPKP